MARCRSLWPRAFSVTEGVRLLLERGADVHEHGKKHATTPYAAAAARWKPSVLRVGAA
jgi:hypothetical protein